MITGKRSHCVNHGVERTYTFENDKKQLLQFTLRVYNDGVAFRYQLPQHIDATKGKTEILLSEHTTIFLKELNAGCRLTILQVMNGSIP